MLYSGDLGLQDILTLPAVPRSLGLGLERNFPSKTKDDLLCFTTLSICWSTPMSTEFGGIEETEAQSRETTPPMQHS